MLVFSLYVKQTSGLTNLKIIRNGLKIKRNPKRMKRFGQAHQKQPMICSAWMAPSVNLASIR